MPSGKFRRSRSEKCKQSFQQCRLTFWGIQTNSRIAHHVSMQSFRWNHPTSSDLWSIWASLTTTNQQHVLSLRISRSFHYRRFFWSSFNQRGHPPILSTSNIFSSRTFFYFVPVSRRPPRAKPYRPPIFFCTFFPTTNITFRPPLLVQAIHMLITRVNGAAVPSCTTQTLHDVLLCQ